MIRLMRITPAQLVQIAQKEKMALLEGLVRLSRRQAERWCLVHVGDDWYRLPSMLVVRGYNGDYTNFTEVDPESVYELEEFGCFIEMPPSWSSYALWRRDSTCICGHPAADHDMRFDEKCWFSGGRCGCSQYRPIKPDIVRSRKRPGDE